mgnify:CR=1 FL=1
MIKDQPVVPLTVFQVFLQVFATVGNGTVNTRSGLESVHEIHRLEFHLRTEAAFDGSLPQPIYVYEMRGYIVNMPCPPLLALPDPTQGNFGDTPTNSA